MGLYQHAAGTVVDMCQGFGDSRKVRGNRRQEQQQVKNINFANTSNCHICSVDPIKQFLRVYHEVVEPWH